MPKQLSPSQQRRAERDRKVEQERIVRARQAAVPIDQPDALRAALEQLAQATGARLTVKERTDDAV